MDTSSNLCKNCGETTSGKYCINCGQETKTGRIDRHYIIHEIQHTVFHVDRGILYTIKELLVRPGSTIREYLLGKRVSYFKPFAFVIIMGTIYGFMGYFFKVYPEESIMFSDPGNADANRYSQQTIDWIYGHYSLVMLAFIPFYALASYIMFRKTGYNYIEFLVISSYISGIQIFLHIVTYFIYYLTLSDWIVGFILLISYLYAIWTYIQLFGTKSWVSVIFRTLISTVLSVFFIMITSTAFFVILFILFPGLRP